MSSKKKILFVVNPKAGVDRLKAIEDAIEKYLDKQRFEPEIARTAYPKHGVEIAQNAVQKGFDVVVAIGGDGSVNDIINGLHGSDTALAIIPRGSGNGLARTVGIPFKLEKAIAAINKQDIHAIDLGEANGRYFISNAGFGFDAVVTKKFEGKNKRGLLGYMKIITQKIWSYKAQNWEIEIDGVRFSEKAFMITVANATQLGYNFFVAPHAKLNDGLFDIVVIRDFPRFFGAIIGLQAFSALLDKSRYVKVYSGKKVTVRSKDNTVMQMDGDAVACGEQVTLNILPKTLKICVP